MKKNLTFTLLLCALIFMLFTSPVYAACPTIGPCPIDSNPPAAGLNEIEQIVGNIISVVVRLGFVAMLVLLISAGFKYLTSGGEPKAIQSAHYTVTMALLGVVLMAMAWLILLLVENFTGLPVTIFNIKSLCVGPISPLEFCK